jgi:hypothetical protein
MWQPGRCSWQEKQPLDCTNSSFTLDIHAEFESMINCRWVCIVYHLIVPSCDLALIVVWFSFHECCFQVPQTIDICLLHVIWGLRSSLLLWYCTYKSSGMMQWLYMWVLLLHAAINCVVM